ncbi:MAG TPA: hypothetical protein VJ124_17185 [Pyrinomonadaceae bacterium]|nr:hypothetical protein [Pyrinomonadaceae bacterium]
MSFGKRQLVITLLIHLMCYLPVCSQKKTDRQVAGLNGLVKSVRVESSFFIYLFGELKETNSNRQSFTAYDRKGNITTHFSYKGYDELIIRDRSIVKKDDLEKKGTYSYDSDGRLNDVVWVNSAGSLLEKDLYVYEQDKLVAMVRYSSSGAIEKKQTVVKPHSSL